MCERKVESEFDLVVGRKYKVCLKPFKELLVLGLVEEWDENRPWYKDYLGSDVGCVTSPSQDEWECVHVHWSTGGRFFYNLEVLKILGEV